MVTNRGSLGPSGTAQVTLCVWRQFSLAGFAPERSFVFRERWRLSIIGEVFNLYNKVNLTGYSGDLTSAAFGQPTTRATQVFGSGGPRVSTSHASQVLICNKRPPRA